MAMVARAGLYTMITRASGRRAFARNPASSAACFSPTTPQWPPAVRPDQPRRAALQPREVREKAPGTQVLAVVKPTRTARVDARLPALEDADGLALVEPDSAIDLRRRVHRRILLLEGFFHENELPEYAQRRLATVVHHMEQVRMLEKAVLARPLEVFVKVNVGMNRLGSGRTTWPACAIACRRRRRWRAAPHDAFRACRRGRRPQGVARGLRVGVQGLSYPRSMANSAGVIRFPEVGGDIVRPGIMLLRRQPLPYDTATCWASSP
jgi:alanine racemase